jgi:hypothetical protein
MHKWFKMSADDVFSWANGLLIFSLILGVLSTYAIVTSGKIKEKSQAREIAASNERAAEANARALEATLALENFKSPRILTNDAQHKITAKIDAFAGTQFDVAATQDREAINLITNIEDSLNAAGWNEVPVSGNIGTVSASFDWPCDAGSKSAEYWEMQYFR